MLQSTAGYFFVRITDGLLVGRVINAAGLTKTYRRDKLWSNFPKRGQKIRFGLLSQIISAVFVNPRHSW